MLGKASEIKTWYVEPPHNGDVSTSINKVLGLLADREVISIDYQKSQNEMISDSALITYKKFKEGEHQ